MTEAFRPAAPENSGARVFARAPCSFSVIDRSADGSKATFSCDDHIVGVAGAVDDQEIPRLVPTAYDAHVFVSGIEHQIPRKGLLPGDRGAIGVLGMAPPPCPMTYSPPLVL